MEEEVHGFVIVGGGICGLATALALHRKGISSLVLEKSSETLRTDGVAIGVHANGWRALDQLGLATELRETANIITGLLLSQSQVTRDIFFLWKDNLRFFPHTITIIEPGEKRGQIRHCWHQGREGGSRCGAQHGHRRGHHGDQRETSKRGRRRRWRGRRGCVGPTCRQHKKFMYFPSKNNDTI
ncbi:hypothetical protein SORBI_3010G162101 [Sorghum bicolor]|uniref:FAD-binding domain-containing protein n=1 Tax=Sorghum bicolor TaxID=4558 RepID=A0A1W0VTE0_SORBI|nr:hypothetical protein SORBI_3010G162101 [Sorghum bicolor]